MDKPAWGDIMASAVMPLPMPISDGRRPVWLSTPAASILRFSALTAVAAALLATEDGDA